DADVLDPAGAPQRQGRAALAVMDPDGRVAGGRVGGLSVVDAGAPGGLRLDPGAVVAAAAAALAAHDLVLVELADLDRVDAERAETAPAAHAAALAAALAATDALLGDVLALADPARDLVVV